MCNSCRVPKREANKPTHWGGSIRPWCTYVYLSVTLGRGRHIHTVSYVNVTIFTKRYSVHARMDTGNANGWRLLWRDGEGWQERERVLQNISGWLREKAFAAVCTSNIE